MKADAVIVKRGGISVRITETKKNKVTRYIADYRVNGVRKQVWRSTIADARAAASEAIDKIIAGQSEVLSLTNSDAHIYLRAREHADAIKQPLDIVARDYAEVVGLLAGRVSPVEACRDWLKRHNVAVPQKTVADACTDCLDMARVDKKSKTRISHLSAIFDAFKADNNLMLVDVTPALVQAWLAGLKWSERTRRNYRDAIGHLNRWCVVRGYLAKGTDWLEGVQNYSARKLSEIEIYSPEEVAAIISKADNGMLPFIVIQAFAGLRHAEVARLDWSEIELSDKEGDSFIEVRAAKSKTGERRLVPVQDNLKAWLLQHRKERGPVCDYANTAKQLAKIATDAKVEWKHNALRHSFISYRVAATADVPRVADEAGNSVQVIRGHYLRRVKPAEAARWFAIAPLQADNVTQMPTAKTA
jgi:integrase